MSTTPPPTPPPTPPTPAVPPAAAAAPVVPAKKSNTLLWVLGGCGTIIILGIVVVTMLGFFVMNKAKQAGLDPELIQKNPVLAVAKMTVAANPDLETVSNDDSSGTIVVRDKKTGKVVTWKVDSEKRIMVVTDEQGKTTTMKLDSNNRLVVTDDQGKTATITANTNSGNLEIKGPEGTVKIGNNSDKAPGWVPVYPGSTPQSTMSVSANGNQSGTYVFVTQDASDKVLSFYGDAFKASGMTASTTSNNTDGKVSGIVSGSDQDHKRSVLVTVSPETDGTHVSVSFEEKKSAN